jgi:hypothetical protein
MAVVQNTFVEDIPGGFAGMQADGELSNIVSLILEGSTDCPFGTPVFRGSADRGVVLDVSANLRGIALATSGLPVTSDRPADHYAPGDTIPVIERGKVWVTCNSSGATDGAQVYAVTATGVITSSSSSATALTGWFFDETRSGAGLVRIVRR